MALLLNVLPKSLADSWALELGLPIRLPRSRLSLPTVSLLDRRRQKSPVNADVRAGDKAAGLVRCEEHRCAD